MSSSPRRVVFAGIDGATWDIIEPMVAAGKLPNLAATMRAGSYGPLKSTIPPNSSLAWSSFQTGVHPGKHGIFFFREQSPGSYVRPVVSWNSVQAPSIWKLAAEAGKKVCVVTVPLTFPPEQLENGFMMGGLMTPDRHSEFIWPPEMRAELEQAIGDVPADNEPEILYHSAGEAQGYKSLLHVIEQITRIGEYLIEKHKPDLFALVYRQVDLTSHSAWCFQDPEWQRKNPGKWEAKQHLLAGIYEAVDAGYGRLRAKALALDGEVAFGTCSDHGFGRITYTYYMNKWLVDHGYLVLKGGVTWQRLRLWQQKTWHKILRRTGVQTRMALKGKRLPNAEQLIMTMIDWSKTRAYSSFSGGEDIVLINLKGREPQGIVEPGAEYERLREEIIAKLPTMRAVDGGRVISAAFKREEIWDGPQLFLAPDIQCMTVDTACNMGASPVHPVHAEEAKEGRPAMHRFNGIYAWEGAGIFKPGERIGGPQIADMGSTILHLLGLPLDDHLDGRVMEECLTDEYRARHPIERRHGHVKLVPRDVGAADRSGSDEERLMETMRALGYME
jgi:predicted AlkP superfamily phosphohydrolase/phosphomutase